MPSGNWLVASTDPSETNCFASLCNSFGFWLSRLLWVRDDEDCTKLMKFVLERQACTAELRTGTCILRLEILQRCSAFLCSLPAVHYLKTKPHSQAADTNNKGSFLVCFFLWTESQVIFLIHFHSIQLYLTDMKFSQWVVTCLPDKIFYSFGQNGNGADVRNASRNSKFPCYLLNIKHGAGTFTISVRTPAKKTRSCSK